MNPIETRKDDIRDDFHGTQVSDPYRWLEDAASEEVVAWTEAQNRRTQTYLAGIPARERIRQRLTELWDFPRYTIPRKEGDRYYFSKNDGLQNQPVLYRQQTLEGDPIVVVDPNTLSEDGTVALIGQSFSENGRLMAYATASSGSDWQEVRIRDVDARHDFDEVLRWCKFAGMAWKKDGSGFFYNRLPEPGSVPPEDENHYSRVYWHHTGTPQSDDPLVYERPDAKELRFQPVVTDDGRYLLLHVTVGTDPRNRVYYRDIESNDGEFVRLFDDADAMYEFIANDGPLFYFHTNLDAPRGRIIAIDTSNPARENWREILPEGDEVISHVDVANDRFVVVSMQDVQHRVRLYRLNGDLEREIELPDIGSVEALSCKRHETELFLQFTSFLYPSTPLRYDFASGELTTLHESTIDFDPSGYETKQIFVTSKDGTRVPMFVVHKRGLKLDGNNPALLYGYGGFNISMTPGFRIPQLVLLEAGGVFAVANLRGGNEYGEDWHQAGMLDRKQNVFDDFIAAAECLIAEGYTSTSKLAINGGSNGGLLVGACLTQRPDLYGAAICEVPVTDMLRYHRFTVGHFWVPEYGNAETDSEHFRFMHAYSPLHNVRPGTNYPPTLITSADTDDRVVPAHAKKFAATLQEAQAGNAPILLRVEMKAGHGLGKPTSKIIDERSDVYGFLFEALGVDSGHRQSHQPKND
ncbi:MAG: S9 family peptidase [Chloroflexia bacterium]|nr:S9 family peptidase [Chloroflexia bacterium]